MNSCHVPVARTAVQKCRCRSHAPLDDAAVAAAACVLALFKHQLSTLPHELDRHCRADFQVLVKKGIAAITLATGW